MSEKKKVVITFPADPHVIPGYDNYVAEFEQKGFEVFLDPRYRRLEQDEIIELLQKYNAYAHVVSGEYINNKVLDACPHAKMFVKMGVGWDNMVVPLFPLKHSLRKVILLRYMHLFLTRLLI